MTRLRDTIGKAPGNCVAQRIRIRVIDDGQNVHGCHSFDVVFHTVGQQRHNDKG